MDITNIKAGHVLVINDDEFDEANLARDGANLMTVNE